MFELQWRPKDSLWDEGVWLFYSRRDSLQHQLARRDNLNQTNQFYEYRVIDEEGEVYADGETL